MEKKYFITAILAITLFLSCNHKVYSIKNDEKEYKKYYSKDSLSVLELKEINDSLIGQQCFTTFDGKKTDCCLNSQSLLLKKTSINTFSGKMKSCYDENFHEIEIEFHEDKLVFIISKDDHDFLSKESIFYK